MLPSIMRTSAATAVRSISASTCFEKGKNQNVLRVADIDSIVNAFRTRAETERFSHRATLAEITENDFNLNIPRYVDTFEAEAEIDLTAVAAEVRMIDGNMAALDTSIREFCVELGLEAPV